MKALRAILAVLLVLCLACGGFEYSSAKLNNARMARDEQGQQPTNVFGPNDTFWCLVDLSFAPDDTLVTASWWAVSVQGIAGEQKIDEASLKTASAPLHFNLTPSQPWPAGNYKVDLYINQQLDQTVNFQVQ